MGSCCSADGARDSSSRGVLVLGLDGAGATTILYQLVLRKRLETIPTLGVNHEIISHDAMELECWDIGGLDKMRPLWSQYSRDSDAVIFVVDAADMTRLKLAAEELAALYTTTSRRNSIQSDHPLLILANKQDLPNAVSPEVVHDVLNVSSLPVQQVKVFPCTANDRQSLIQGVSWLTTQLKNKRPLASPPS